MAKVLMVKGNTETYVDELLVTEYEEKDWKKVEVKEDKAPAKSIAGDKATTPKK